MRSLFPILSAGLLAAVLAACGAGNGGDGAAAGTATRIDELANSTRGIEAIAFDGNDVYLALGNSTTSATSVMKSIGSVSVVSQWAPTAMGACALPALGPDEPPRAPRLKQLNGKTWLYQAAYGGPQEHALCALDAASATWAAKDDGLRVCHAGYCEVLWMNDLQAAGTRLLSNAGAGQNLLQSNDAGASWQPIMGRLDAFSCTHQAFAIVGTRVLVGGECPLDEAYLRAYALTADGIALASPAALPLTLPALENRNIQFITAIAGSERVFAGVEGGLLRSDDGGKSFTFAFAFSQADKRYPYVTQLLSPKGKPNVVIAAGFDKATGKPYLTWSNDGGKQWTELSALLPRYARSSPSDDLTAQVTSLAEDPSGRIVLTMNDEPDRKGRLLLLTLGQP